MTEEWKVSIVDKGTEFAISVFPADVNSESDRFTRWSDATAQARLIENASKTAAERDRLKRENEELLEALRKMESSLDERVEARLDQLLSKFKGVKCATKEVAE